MNKLLVMTGLATVIAATCGCSGSGKQSDFQATYQNFMPWQVDEPSGQRLTETENVRMELWDDEQIESQKSPRRWIYNADSYYADDTDDELIEQLADELWEEEEEVVDTTTAL